MKVLIAIGIAMLVAASIVLVTDSRSVTSGVADATAVSFLDSASAPVVTRWQLAHTFEPLPDGGRIVLQSTRDDPWGPATVRAQIRDVANRFALADFTIAGFVNEQFVPGTDVMTAKHAVIRYVPDTLPDGGELRIVTTDPVAIINVHAFLAHMRRNHPEPAKDSVARDSLQRR